MSNNSSQNSKRNVVKKSLFLTFGICIFVFMFWYVNTFIYKFQAAYPIVNVTFTPSSVAVNLNQEDDFAVSFNINGQKATAAELYLDYDPAYVEYFKEFTTGTGFSEIKDPGKENYFDIPLIEEVSSPAADIKRLRLVVVSKFNNPNDPSWLTNVTGSLKFRAKKAGTTTITLNKTVTALAGVTGAGDATYFDLPSSEIKTTINISGTGGTGSPTPPVTSGTITPTSKLSPTSVLSPTAKLSPTSVLSPTVSVTMNPSISPSIDPSLYPTGGNPGGYQNVTLNFKLRFQGMPSGQPADGAVRSLPVYIALLGDSRASQNNLGVGTIEFKSGNNGVWTSSVTARIDTSRKWNLFVKGPKHLRKRICTNVPQEPIPGGYQCPSEISIGNTIYQMTLKAGVNEIDLSNILMLAGDIPIQNGIIDAVDIAFIRQNFGSQDAAVKARGDLNYDGIVDAQDYSLILASLAFKYDEE